MPMTTLEKLARQNPYWDKATFRLGTQEEADSMGIIGFSVGKQMPSKDEPPESPVSDKRPPGNTRIRRLSAKQKGCTSRNSKDSASSDSGKRG